MKIDFNQIFYYDYDEIGYLQSHGRIYGKG